MHRAHLSKLPLPQFLPEDEAFPWKLGSGDVFPCQRVCSEGGNGVSVAAGNALQLYNQGLSIVRNAGLEALVMGTLGNVRLGVTTAQIYMDKHAMSLIITPLHERKNK